MVSGTAGALANWLLDGTWPDSARAATPDRNNAAPRPHWQNWSGLQNAWPVALPRPQSEAALQAFMRSTHGEIRAVGSGHSFTAVVPTSGHIVSLDRMAGLIAVDKQAMTATVHAGTRLGVLTRALAEHGLALRNLPDIDAQTIAGAIATGTHGTGASLPALHADVVGLRIVRPDGKVIALHESQDRDMLAAARVSLGGLGVISQVTMRVWPAYKLHRKVWLLPIEQLLDQAPDLAARHRHFECYHLPFTGYGAAITHDVYQGEDLSLPPGDDDQALADLRRLRDWLSRFPALRAWVAQTAIRSRPPEEARHHAYRLLPTVRPMKFNESEWHVPREQGIACFRHIIAAMERHSEAYFPIEFRYVKGDDAWLSPFHDRDSCSIAVHAAFDEPWGYLIKDGEPIFRAHQGRPHWGKLHLMHEADLAGMYPRWRNFQALRQQFDPQGRMLNAHLRQLFSQA